MCVNHFITPQIVEVHFALLSGKVTTDAIIVLRSIIEKARNRKQRNNSSNTTGPLISAGFVLGLLLS